jgi:hypothetical protein
MNSSLFHSILIAHIICGIIGFIVAPIALMLKKGSRGHKRWGKIFFYAMTGVAATAIVMAPVKHNIFLTCIAVFSFYLAFSGFRAVYRRRHTDGKPVLIDWLFLVLDLIFSAGLIIFGIVSLPGSFAIVPIILGSLGVLLGTRDLALFTRPKSKHDWIFAHIVGMVASYISAVSAFSAVNLNFEWLPGWIQWLWPTIIGVPLLSRYTRNYRKKLTPPKVRTETIV